MMNHWMHNPGKAPADIKENAIVDLMYYDETKRTHCAFATVDWNDPHLFAYRITGEVPKWKADPIPEGLTAESTVEVTFVDGSKLVALAGNVQWASPLVATRQVLLA